MTDAAGSIGGADDGLRVTVSERGSDARVTVSGDLDVMSAPCLRAVLREACRGQAWVEVDLSGVTSIDCSGLDALLEAEALVGDWFTIQDPSRAVARLVTLLPGADALPAAFGARGSSAATSIGEVLFGPQAGACAMTGTAARPAAAATRCT